MFIIDMKFSGKILTMYRCALVLPAVTIWFVFYFRKPSKSTRLIFDNRLEIYRNEMEYCQLLYKLLWFSPYDTHIAFVVT